MTFYRVHYYDEHMSSSGFEWFTSKAKATKAANDFNTNQDAAHLPNATVDTIIIAPTKAGILAALGHYATHADNG